MGTEQAGGAVPATAPGPHLLPKRVSRSRPCHVADRCRLPSLTTRWETLARNMPKAPCLRRPVRTGRRIVDVGATSRSRQCRYHKLRRTTLAAPTPGPPPAHRDNGSGKHRHGTSRRRRACDGLSGRVGASSMSGQRAGLGSVVTINCVEQPSRRQPPGRRRHGGAAHLVPCHGFPAPKALHALSHRSLRLGRMLAMGSAPAPY